MRDFLSDLLDRQLQVDSGDEKLISEHRRVVGGGTMQYAGRGGVILYSVMVSDSTDAASRGWKN